MNWHKDQAGQWFTDDGRFHASYESIPQSCAGPHPSPLGDGSAGDFCDGDWMHYANRWVLVEAAPGSFTAAGDEYGEGYDIVLIAATLRDCKRYVG